MLQFELLKAELGAMKKWRQCLFAAMTAERTAEWFRLYARQRLREIAAFDRGLSYVWSRLGGLDDLAGLGGSGDSNEAEIIEAMIPLEDDEARLSAQAEDAASALIYAVRSLYSPGQAEAVWAAERAYNIVDNYVNSTADWPGNVPAGYVDSHPLLDREIDQRTSDLSLARLASRIFSTVA